MNCLRAFKLFSRTSPRTRWSVSTSSRTRTSPAKRARTLNRLAQLLDERTDELAVLESRNNGKPKWQAAAEMTRCNAHMRFTIARER